MGAETAAIAGAMARARRTVLSHFLSLNAVSPETAVPFVPERRLQRRFLAGLQDRGVVVPARNATFWIDVPKYDAYRQGRRRRVAIVVGLLAAFLGAAVALGMFR